MKRIDRRNFIVQSAQILSYPAFAHLYVNTACTTTADAKLSSKNQHYNWNNTLELPNGFKCQVIDRFGERMSDGYRTPGLPDGMACFDGGKHWILMRNHEIGSGQEKWGPYFGGQSAPSQAYNPNVMGGVTRVVVDKVSLQRVGSHLSLVGTSRNCAGGVSPWGWLSCEESFSDGHGYVFICDPTKNKLQAPKRVPEFGRFNHEAAVVDPQTNITYLSEDREDGCLYRFLPVSSKQPFVGKLQALKIVDKRNYDTAELRAGAAPLSVEWIDIADSDPRQDTIRSQARSKGAARIKRGEGMWIYGKRIFVSATNGGPVGHGQILSLDIATKNTASHDRLSVMAESTNPQQLSYPDNITVAPWGELWVVEDNLKSNAIRVIDHNGRSLYFGRNIISAGEFTGICFSTDGGTMFLNLQEEGLTLAIQGPFRSFSQSFYRV